jgi:hypothetical protein
MATTNVTFNNAIVYDVKKFDVKLGEIFGLELMGQDSPTDWYAKADEVLEIRQEGNAAQVEATGVGTTSIRMYTQQDQKVMEVMIEVLEEIQGPVTDLGLKAGQPEPKKSRRAAS